MIFIRWEFMFQMKVKLNIHIITKQVIYYKKCYNGIQKKGYQQKML